MLLLVGISDFNRPAEKLSATQNVALTATGMIWTRWCFVIKPRNILYCPPNLTLSIFLSEPPPLNKEEDSILMPR